ncbi:hypothetical protein AB0D49_03245 [Streptomyces sp. NPDC048290]|uniref:hypothetical protein n=1 Tax=Streptomyces sp. NPDC048290 TaxID=3155811 RepID=UPI00344A391F
MLNRWRGTFHELTAAAMALAAAFALLLWAAPGASAGGPTSVLIVSPQSLESAALYYSDEEYGKLEGLLSSPGKGSSTAPPRVQEAQTRQINVTWMAHDISPHRFDRVFLVPDSETVWIYTTLNPPVETGTWHLAADPLALRALLSELGVVGKFSDGGSSGVFPAPLELDSEGIAEEPAAEPTAEQAAESSRPAAAATTASDTEDWWWALPGLAAGAVLALALRPLALRLPATIETARLRRREGGPRQELRDI